MGKVRAADPLAAAMVRSRRARQHSADRSLRRRSTEARQQSAVADTDPPENAVPEDDPYARFKCKTPRVGAHYQKTQLQLVWEAERRRGHGDGRYTNQCVVREMIMEWCIMIRHSVDVKIMVRFPKNVLLVKAQMLQEE